MTGFKHAKESLLEACQPGKNSSSSSFNLEGYIQWIKPTGISLVRTELGRQLCDWDGFILTSAVNHTKKHVRKICQNTDDSGDRFHEKKKDPLSRHPSLLAYSQTNAYWLSTNKQILICN